MAACVLSALLLGLAQAASLAPAEKPYGILLLAHGGSVSWNAEVRKLRRELEAEAPTELALGMADSREIRKAIERLEARGPAKIIAVPLFVNSSSEVMDQTRYVLGISDKPSEVFRLALERVARENSGGHSHSGHAHQPFSLERVRTRFPMVLTPALDDHPLVAEVLLERARALSRDPLRETVILVGHGPVDERANGVWLETAKRLARTVRDKGGFRAVRATTIRDDSEAGVKAKAGEALRRAVRQAGGNGGRAIVVPYLIARGGIEDHIVGILQGLSYSWDAKTICPHPNVARWIAEAAREGSKQGDMRLK